MFTLCPAHLTVWSNTTRQPRLRLPAERGAELAAAALLPHLSPARIAILTRAGRLQVWSLTSWPGIARPARRLTKLEAEMEVDRGREAGPPKLAVRAGALYCLASSALLRLEPGGGLSTVARYPPSRPAPTAFSLDRTGAGAILHWPDCSLFYKCGAVRGELQLPRHATSHALSLDGFLLAMFSAGGVEFARVESLWTSEQSTIVPIPEELLPPLTLPSTQHLHVLAPSPALPKQSAKPTSDPKPLTACKRRRAGQVEERPAVGRTGRPGREQLLPLLQSGLLAFPASARPALWCRLLGLPREKRRYLQFCREAGQEAVLPALFAWSPDMRLVPHLPALLRPLLQVFHAHPTTAWELGVAILTGYCWVETYPAPHPALPLATTLLALHRPALAAHLSSLPAPPRSLYWGVLQTGWSDQLEPGDHLKLWDHIITAGPGLLLTALPATLACLEVGTCTCYAINLTLRLAAAAGLHQPSRCLLVALHLPAAALRVRVTQYRPPTAGPLSRPPRPPAARLLRHLHLPLRAATHHTGRGGAGCTAGAPPRSAH